jgi:hypothetical protein
MTPIDTRRLHILYLNPLVLEDRWAHLHRFLHPGNKDEAGWLSMTCAELNMAAHTFLSCKAKNWDGGESSTLHLRYDLVDSILEVASQTTPPGFLHQAGTREQPEVD